MDYAVLRQPSTTSSSASSGYSHSSGAYEFGRAPSSIASTSPSSVYSHGAHAHAHHKRGQSEASRIPPTLHPSKSVPPTPMPENIYGAARQSLRPLPRDPAVATPTATRVNSRHDRGQSLDIGRLSLFENDKATSPSPSPRSSAVRPNSMLLTRSSDTVRRGSDVGPPPLVHAHTSPLVPQDLKSLGRSSTNELRTLSRMVQSSTPQDLALISPTQEVTGLRGRRRLARSDTVVPGRRTDGWEGRNWMDKQRQFLQAYEYLCHIGEAKEWIEDIIHRTIPPIVELEEALRDGVTLAEIVEALNPNRRFKIFHHHRLQYRHSDNIAIFFRYLDEVELPDLFRFELIDLYEKKNIPKVIHCIHALSWLLFRKGIVDFRIGNLVGQLEFAHHELEATQKGLDKLGASMPSFGNMGADFGVEPVPEPEPVETEEERIDRELAENEAMIVDLQAQARGALLRMELGQTMQNLWDSEEWLVDLQARIRGDFGRQITDYRLQMRRFAVGLQGAARGFLVRQRQNQKEAFWKSKEKDILKLQSLVRASKVRREVREERSQLHLASGPIRDVQATFRGFLARKRMVEQQQETVRESGPVTGLQAAIRGMLLRTRLDEDQEALQQEAGPLMGLQAALRAMLTRSQIEVQKETLQGFAPQWTALQAACRASMARSGVSVLKAELKTHVPLIGMLQAHARANAVRREISEKLESLEEQEDNIVDLQARVRGMLERKRLSDDLEIVYSEEDNIISLQSHIRGFLSRSHHSNLLGELDENTEQIASLQALARAMLLRAEVATLLDNLDAQEESVTMAQSIAKAFIVRAKFEEKKRFFKENMQKVVKIQSFVRAKLQGEAYKSLTGGKNPPVNAVKNFVHLLNDSDFDFNEEVEFERLRKTVVQQVRQNEMLEQYIDQLDIKIALLVKNKITLDEVVRHQSNFGGHTSNLLANSGMASANQFDLKALNKGSRKKLESYQQLFFALQTQPQYLARLFKRVREQNTAEKELKRIEHLMMGLFGYAQKRREEYYLLKLIGRSIREEVEGCHTLQDYLRGNFFWTKLVHNYTRSPRDRKFLRDLLGPLIRDNIIEDPALDLESDPMQIYRAAINNEELRTGRPSTRPLDIPRELAIKDPETKEVFIDHLRDLREICDQYLLALEDLIPRVPYGLRYVCRQTFESLCQHFQREHHQILLQIVGNWIWRFYLQPALLAPENVGVTEKQLGPLQKRNLAEVAKVLGQIATGRRFGGENIYLQPLNAFVAESIERFGHIIETLIAVPDAESTFDIDEFNDLYAKNKPTLYIKMTDIFAIHNLIATELPFLCPNRDDTLREIVADLGSVKNNESEMVFMGSSDIQMFLTPKLHDVEDPDAEVKALFMETKRCILYIIRVQTGANLLEILVKPISRDDENKWRTLVRDDFASGTSTRGAYSDANNMVDVTSMSYSELKRTALENVMRLEHMGRISKHNYYQDVLNAIALDIRTKSRRRVQRQRELDGVRLTLANLHDKAKYLEQQRKSYDDYIEQAMATLQNKKGYVPPFLSSPTHTNMSPPAKNASSSPSPSNTTTSATSSAPAASPSSARTSTRPAPSRTRASSSPGRASPSATGVPST